MKLRLTARGWETYTGQMGVIFFENGLSVSDVLPIDAVRVAGVIGAEWENGQPANVSQIYLDNMNTPASSARDTTDAVVEKKEVIEAIEAAIVAYTEEQLAEIADAKGIAGLREIADGLNIKGNSIRGLIDAIVKSGSAQKAS